MKINIMLAEATALVKGQDLDAWNAALSDESKGRDLASAVVQVLPETTNPDAVMMAVKAFMIADMPIRHHRIRIHDELVGASHRRMR